MMDFVGRAKYDAWKELSGKSLDEAKQAYIDLVAQLKAADGK
jgi:acyl-CoA-binding protein